MILSFEFTVQELNIHYNTTEGCTFLAWLFKSDIINFFQKWNYQVTFPTVQRCQNYLKDRERTVQSFLCITQNILSQNTLPDEHPILTGVHIVYTVMAVYEKKIECSDKN